MKIAQPKWFKQKERVLNSTGKLDLSGEIIQDLSFIGSRPSMKILDLSFSSIRSFEGLAAQPKLDYLILDGSTISSFKNASSISKITKISLTNTPVSSIPNYKLSLLIVCGKNLRVINGKIIPEKLKRKAESYPPIVSKLIDSGWMAEYPCPDDVDIEELCIEYGIQYEPSAFANSNDFSLQNPVDIDGFITEYSNHHEEMIQRSQFMRKPNHYCSMSVTDSNQDYLMNGFQNKDMGVDQEIDLSQLPFLVSQIIKKYGFDIAEGDPVSTITSALINIFNVAEGINAVNVPFFNEEEDLKSFSLNYNENRSPHQNLTANLNSREDINQPLILPSQDDYLDKNEEEEEEFFEEKNSQN